MGLVGFLRKPPREREKERNLSTAKEEHDNSTREGSGGEREGFESSCERRDGGKALKNQVTRFQDSFRMPKQEPISCFLESYREKSTIFTPGAQ